MVRFSGAMTITIQPKRPTLKWDGRRGEHYQFCRTPTTKRRLYRYPGRPRAGRGMTFGDSRCSMSPLKSSGVRKS